MNTLRLILRRATVVVAVVLSLAVGTLAVRAASDWTAAAAPLAVEPVSARSLTEQLAAEQARSAALEAQLNGLLNQSRDLTAALGAAGARADEDSKTAADLQVSLAAAKAKLAAMEKLAAQRAAQLKAQAAAAQAARTAATTRRTTTHSTTGASGAASGAKPEAGDD